MGNCIITRRGGGETEVKTMDIDVSGSITDGVTGPIRGYRGTYYQQSAKTNVLATIPCKSSLVYLHTNSTTSSYAQAYFTSDYYGTSVFASSGIYIEGRDNDGNQHIVYAKDLLGITISGGSASSTHYITGISLANGTLTLITRLNTTTTHYEVAVPTKFASNGINIGVYRDRMETTSSGCWSASVKLNGTIIYY